MEKENYSESSSDTETESGGEEDEEESEEQENEVENIKTENQGSTSQRNGNKKVLTEQKMKIEHVTDKVISKSASSKLASEKSPNSCKKKKQPTRSSLLTGRGVTTQMLIDEQILEAGEKCLAINYLGRKFVGDLNTDGTIKCHNANQIFSSPSAWAMHCKKQVNPDKKSGCGWASVKYKGRKLDEFKSTWFRKQKITQAVAASSGNDSVSPGHYSERYCSPYKVDDKGQDISLGDNNIRQDESKHNTKAGTKSTPLKGPIKGRVKNLPIKSPSPEKSNSGYVPPTQNYLTFSEALEAVQSGQPVNTFSKITDRTSSPRNTTKMSTQYSKKSFTTPDYIIPTKPPRKRIARTRISVKHSMVQANSDPTTLVECAQFQSTGKIQPFSITISTSILLLIDFHCHLAMTEVTGYLAGKWDVSRQHLRATQAYPCRYLHSSNKQEIDQVESEIRNDMESKGLILLGWYHSHPFCQPDPSLNDIKSQLEYQQALKDGHYEPCVGLIVSPYDSYKKESQFNAFWVRAPLESSSNQVGLPLSVRFTTHQDQVLTQDLVNEMVALVNYYRDTSDIVKFTEIWSAESSYLDKLKHSVIRKFPQDQTDGRFLDFLHKMLMAACS